MIKPISRLELNSQPFVVEINVEYIYIRLSTTIVVLSKTDKGIERKTGPIVSHSLDYVLLKLKLNLF